MTNQLAGKKLGKYQIQAALGKGGMGMVYAGYDPLLDRKVAIKVLAPHLVWEEGFVERFLREARAAARIKHPHIVTVYDVGQEQDQFYFVMEYLEGQTLADYIRQRGALPPDEALSILHPLADALDYAHQRQLVHRDIKPSNIMVGGGLRVTLTDFGIARAAQETRLTSTGAIMGTPEYMSPEQAWGEEVGHQTDLYSLAVVAYEMLSGRVPFSGTTPHAVLYKQIHEPPPPIRDSRPDLPPGVEPVLLRALDKDPGKRYATAEAFVGGLDLSLAEKVPATPEEPSTLLLTPDQPPSAPEQPAPTPVRPRTEEPAPAPEQRGPAQVTPAPVTPAPAAPEPEREQKPASRTAPAEQRLPRRLWARGLVVACLILVLIAAVVFVPAIPQRLAGDPVTAPMPAPLQDFRLGLDGRSPDQVALYLGYASSAQMITAHGGALVRENLGSSELWPAAPGVFLVGFARDWGCAQQECTFHLNMAGIDYTVTYQAIGEQGIDLDGREVRVYGQQQDGQHVVAELIERGSHWWAWWQPAWTLVYQPGSLDDVAWVYSIVDKNPNGLLDQDQVPNLQRGEQLLLRGLWRSDHSLAFDADQIYHFRDSRYIPWEEQPAPPMPTVTLAPRQPPVEEETGCIDPLGCALLRPEEPIAIGYLVSLSEPHAELNLTVVNGIEMAVQEKREILGHPIELVGSDSGCEPDSAFEAADALVANPRLLAAIGPTCSGAVHAAAERLCAGNIPLISPSSIAPELTGPDRPTGFHCFLRIASHETETAEAAAQFAISLGARRAATIQDPSPLSERLVSLFSTHFQELGGEIVAQEGLGPGTPDAAGLLERIAESEPQVLYTSLHVEQGVEITRLARAIPPLRDVALIGADSMLTRIFPAAAGEAAMGAFLTGPDVDVVGQTYFEFLDRYLEIYGEPPRAPFHAPAHDAALMVFDAIEKAAIPLDDGSLLVGRQALLEALFTTRNLKGVTGSLSCTEQGYCGHPSAAVYEITSPDRDHWHPGASPEDNPRKVWP